MNRLWTKLTLAFLAIALLAVGVVAVLSARSTGEEFRQYVVGAGMAPQAAWAEEVVAFYTERGSWAGVEQLLVQLGPGMGMSRGRGGMGVAGPNLAVADASGYVVASRTGEMVGERLPASALDQGVPLRLSGQAIGTLVSVRPAEVVLDAQGQSFLRQVQMSLVLSGIAATLLALLLGGVVSQRLTAPLARLTRAATAIADGDLAQRVAVGSGDEIGQLAAAFNRMAMNLAQAETLRRNMVADVAHELRTPLTVIQGGLQAMLDGVYPLNAAQVASLYDETHLLTRLVDDLHNLALADAGQLRIERLPVDMTALARTAVSNFAPAAVAAGVRLLLNDAASGGTVVGDADRLAQVLRNLVSNSLRHTPPGGHVTVNVEARANQVCLEVADSGSGIALEDLPHVFDRFYRGDKSRSRRGGGAGLGLAIARQIVVLHGGEIAVDSRLGEGTVFTILLPSTAETQSPAVARSGLSHIPAV